MAKEKKSGSFVWLFIVGVLLALVIAVAAGLAYFGKL